MDCTMDLEKKILDENDIARTITRLAHEIVERNHGAEDLALVGIRTRGVFLAERLRAQIEKIDKAEIPLGILDITLYRDDLGESNANPVVNETDLNFDFNQKIDKFCFP